MIVISDGDSDTEERDATGISNRNSPSMLSPNVSYRPVNPPVINERQCCEPKTENCGGARACKLEPIQCSSAQYLESTRAHTASSNANATPKRVPEPQLGRHGVSTNGKDGTALNNSVKKPRKRKLLTSPGNSQTSPPYKTFCAAGVAEDKSSDLTTSPRPLAAHATPVSVIKSMGDNNSANTMSGARSPEHCQVQNDLSANKTPVSVIINTRGNTTLLDDTRVPKHDQDYLSTNNFNNGEVEHSDFPVSSTPRRPQDKNRLVPHLHLSESLIPKEGPSISERSPVRRKKRKHVKDLGLDKEEAKCTTRNDANLPTFLDSNIISSHTKKNSRTQLHFIMQLQAQGFALPHESILELVHEMMMVISPSKRDIMYNILWSHSERFPHATDKDFCSQLYNTIIDSLMATKYYHLDNANMALQYLLNIFCVDWRNSTVPSNSYIATFLLSNTKQLLCEIRKFYEKPPHLFCPHVASTLQKLLCLPLAVMDDPQGFSESVFDEVFVELSREKQKVFLNNLSSPYLITYLTAALLTDYVPLENRDLLWFNHLYFIDTDWISRLLMVAIPYLPDGREDLVYMLWLMTQLLDKFIQYQQGGVILCAPICVTNPLVTEQKAYLENSVIEEFFDRLRKDEIIYNTCLFMPETCYYMKLILTLVEEKITLNFNDLTCMDADSGCYMGSNYNLTV